jgi:hypothetical protein
MQHDHDDTTDEEVAILAACLASGNAHEPAGLAELYAGTLGLSGARVLPNGTVGG